MSQLGHKCIICCQLAGGKRFCYKLTSIFNGVQSNWVKSAFNVLQFVDIYRVDEVI